MKSHAIIGYIEQHYSEGSDTVMTLFEVFQEGQWDVGHRKIFKDAYMEGYREGYKEGRGESRLALGRVTIKLITKHVAPPSDKLAQRIIQQDHATINSILMNYNEWQSLEEIEKILK